MLTAKLAGLTWNREHSLSLVDDWEPVDGDDTRFLIEKSLHAYWSNRMAAWVVCLLEGVSADLEHEVLSCIEDVLKTRPIEQEVLNELIVAPLREPIRANRLATQALGNGCAALGSLLARLYDLQPLLGRLVNAWLLVPNEIIADFESSQQDIWQRVIKSRVLIKLLEAGTGEAFQALWNQLVFGSSESSPAQRSAIQRVGHWMAQRLYPSSARLRRSNPAEKWADAAIDDERELEWRGYRSLGLWNVRAREEGNMRHCSGCRKRR